VVSVHHHYPRARDLPGLDGVKIFEPFQSCLDLADQVPDGADQFHFGVFGGFCLRFYHRKNSFGNISKYFFV
jgi:hypothetical protein